MPRSKKKQVCRAETKRETQANNGNNKVTGCYTCGREGHIVTKCTNSIKRIGEPINNPNSTTVQQRNIHMLLLVWLINVRTI